MQRTSTQNNGLQGLLPLQDLTGETVDISEYLYFGFYNHIYYKENIGLGVTWGFSQSRRDDSVPDIDTKWDSDIINKSATIFQPRKLYRQGKIHNQ